MAANLSTTFSCKISTADLAYLQGRGKKLGISMSGVMRELIRQDRRSLSSPDRLLRNKVLTLVTAGITPAEEGKVLVDAKAVQEIVDTLRKVLDGVEVPK